MSNAEIYVQVLKTEKQILEQGMLAKVNDRTVIGESLIEQRVAGIDFCIKMAEHMILKEQKEPAY